MSNFYPYVTCVNDRCENTITDYCIEKQIEHQHTMKYRLCGSCRRKHKQVILACEECGTISLHIQQKYCRDCAGKVQREMSKYTYLANHPRGNCRNCMVKIDPKIHGGKWKYCSDTCMVDARRRMTKVWYEQNKANPTYLKRRANYQKEYYTKTKEVRQAWCKKYRATEDYKKKSRSYYQKGKDKYVSFRFRKDKLNDKVYILDRIKGYNDERR